MRTCARSLPPSKIGIESWPPPMKKRDDQSSRSETLVACRPAVAPRRMLGKSLRARDADAQGGGLDLGLALAHVGPAPQQVAGQADGHLGRQRGQRRGRDDERRRGPPGGKASSSASRFVPCAMRSSIGGSCARVDSTCEVCASTSDDGASPERLRDATRRPMRSCVARSATTTSRSWRAPRSSNQARAISAVSETIASRRAASATRTSALAAAMLRLHAAEEIDLPGRVEAGLEEVEGRGGAELPDAARSCRAIRRRRAPGRCRSRSCASARRCPSPRRSDSGRRPSRRAARAPTRCAAPAACTSRFWATAERTRRSSTGSSKIVHQCASSKGFCDGAAGELAVEGRRAGARPAVGRGDVGSLRLRARACTRRRAAESSSAEREPCGARSMATGGRSLRWRLQQQRDRRHARASGCRISSRSSK